MKWTANDYKNPFTHWEPPRLLYPCTPSEKESLHALKKLFAPLEPYEELETKAVSKNTLVSLDIPLPDGHIAFLENTAERCTSPTTKHSQAGMQGARHWVQRIDTLEGVFKRLTDGYGISLMFGERCHQYIRNSNNWRGISGMMLDIDVFRDDEHPDAPEPVYSEDKLFDRYPLLPRICSYLIPTASSLYDGRPFKARGIVLFSQPITDQRVYRAFGDILRRELDCIPANVTKNPVAVGFGNTHNAPQAYQNDDVDTDWIHDKLQECKANVITESQHKVKVEQQKAERRAHYASLSGNGTKSGENISTFIEQCDPVAEMVKDGLLTPEKGNDYRWHQSENARSCDILDGVIQIFSHTMSQASPAAALEPVGAHRFYLYQLCGLDMTIDADKPKIKEFLFERGYGSDPKAFFSSRNRKPIKLQNLTPYKKVLETLGQARDFIKRVYEKSAQLFALRTDTGTGKTEYPTTTYALTHDTVIPTTSHRLSSEIKNRAAEKGIHSFAYKGIEYQADPQHGGQVDGITYDQDGYFGCPHSERFEILRSRGYNPYETICGNCEHYLKCIESGYLSQPDQARNAQLKTLPFPTAFLDPRLKNWAKLYKPRGKNALILHDDIPTSQLFIEYHLTAAHLRQIYQDWTGTLAAEWAKECLTAFSLQDWESLKNTILGMSADTYQSVTDALTHCIDPSTNAVIEPNEYLKLEQVNYESPESCLKLPQVDKPNYDAATTLKEFFTRYSRIIDAPFFYEQKTEKLTYYLPPKPYIFNKSVRLGFASATMEKEIMQAIFPEIEFHDAALTEWVDGAGFYQLRTNGNPRRTVLKSKLVEKDGKKSYVYDGLSTTGQNYYDKVIDFIKAHPNEKHAVLTYKAVIDEKKCELDTLGVVTAWFGNLAGLDTTFDGVEHFHILFCPEVGDMGIDMLLKQVYGNADTPIKRNDDGELLRNDNRTFADERAQLVYLSLVIGEIRQAIGRSRLNLYPNKVYLWTSRFIDGYTNRKESILFHDKDWENAGENLDNLAQIVKDRQAHEQAVTEAIEKGDTKAVAELKGVSQGHARKITQEPKAEQRIELARQVTEMIDSGMSQRAVEHGLKISRKKITKLLHEYKAVQNAHALKGLLNADARNAPPLTHTDDTSVPSVLPEKEIAAVDKPVPKPQNSDPAPIPLSEYSSLDDETALLELERCKKSSNYNGAAYLRKLLGKRGVSDKHPVEKVDTEAPMLTLFDWDHVIKTVYLHRDEIPTHKDISQLIAEHNPWENISDDEVLRVDMADNKITTLSVIDKSYIFEFADAS